MPERLKLSFLSATRLWEDVVNTHGEQVFVPTTEQLPVGQALTVAFEIPGLTGPLLVQGTVQGHRPLGGRLPAGVFIKLDEPSLARCRHLAQPPKDTGPRVHGRAEVRVDCALQARVLIPSEAPGTVKSLSAHGLTVHSALSLKQDAVVTLDLRLPDGAEVQVTALVMWSRPELRLVGLRITRMDEATAERLARTVEDLMATGPVETHAPGGVSVVVADDDPSILELLRRVLLKHGLSVTTASRGDQALELVRRARPAAVFLDVLMPGLDGLGVCKALRADVTFASTRVVLLSAMGQDRLRQAVEEVGANDFLLKPMNLEDIRALLQRYFPKKA